MILMICILIVVIIFAILPKYSKRISVTISRYVYKITDNELSIRTEIKDLKSEQDTISMTEEFAKHAKLQRRIDKLSAEVKRLAAVRNSKIAVVNIGVKAGIYVCQAILMLVIVLTNRSEPLLLFPENWFYPFHNIVALPTGVPGGLGVVCWIMVCRTAVNRFISLWSVGHHQKRLRHSCLYREEA
uniref:Guided entry of tail-anchored proteins factor 1 n=1 Tax=Crassostrea virginica TaxID=6565 RepID=A0A8B8ASP4_CRAVI|nr:tail-anchored protein insertion receptor WRB-like [Crassostrea virginica]